MFPFHWRVTGSGNDDYVIAVLIACGKLNTASLEPIVGYFSLGINNNAKSPQHPLRDCLAILNTANVARVSGGGVDVQRSRSYPE